MYCIKTDEKSIPGQNCLLDNDVQGAINVYNVLKPELKRRAVDHYCSDSKIKPFMTEGEIVHFIKENYGLKNEFEIQEDLHNFEVLVFSNPEWEISLVQSHSANVFSNSPAKSMEEVNRNRGTMTTALSVLNPSLPWGCSIYLKLTMIVYLAFILLGIGAFIYLGNLSYKQYKNYSQKKKDELFFMVERIVDILQSNATEGDNFLVINHIRDMILPFNERSSMYYSSMYYKLL